MFSVIIPTHYRLKPLQTLLNSLEAQTYSHKQFEVIVVYLEGDPAESLIMSSSYSFSLIPLKILDPQFKGKSASLKRNEGASKALYPWLAFIDDDCVAHPQWLENAAKKIDEATHAIEGHTQIPKPQKETFTYKGLLALSRFGGYQTCNMFYRKDTFFKVGGFDLNLPFYLEDTDLAWSFIDRSYSIKSGEDVTIEHPVPPPNTYRWIENAIRTRKIPYLAKKHPQLFKKNNFRALSKSSRLFIFFLLLLILISTFTLSIKIFTTGLVAYFILTSFYVFYILRNCSYSLSEVSQMLFYYPFVPPISLIQLLRGNKEQNVFII